MRYVTCWNDLPLLGWGPWGYREPAAAWTHLGEELRSPPDFLLEPASCSGRRQRRQSPPLPVSDLEVGAGGMLAPSLEGSLLPLAEPHRAGLQLGVFLGLKVPVQGQEGLLCGCMQSPLGPALALHLPRLISPGTTLVQ